MTNTENKKVDEVRANFEAKERKISCAIDKDFDKYERTGQPYVSLDMQDKWVRYLAGYMAGREAQEKDALRWQAFRWLGSSDADAEEILEPILQRLFPQNEERSPTADEIDAVADGVAAAMRAQERQGEKRNG
jgi:hypothetical protein